MDNHKLTQALLASLEDTVENPDQLTVVIFDNGSTLSYPGDFDFSWPFKIITVRSEKNRGYYRPITDLAAMATSADLLALIHNDVILVEKGWDRRLRECFLKDGRLGMVGFLGSNEVDGRGGRGGGTMGNFKGERGAKMEHTGRRVTDLQPALIFDSLFIALRQPVVPCLKVDDQIALNHFGDRVWPLRAIENEWRVGVLGIEIDHMSGQTVVGLSRIEQDSRLWCLEHGISVAEGAQAGTAVYLEAERRYLKEYRDEKRLIPARMEGWQIKPLQYR